MAHSPEVRWRKNATGPSTPTSPDAVFEALASEKRRELLAVLQTCEGPTSRAELASLLADRTEEAKRDDREIAENDNATAENDHLTTEDDRESEIDRDRLLARLYHVHLPKLASAGLVRCDEDREVVSATRHPVFDHPSFDALCRHDASSTDAATHDPEATDAVLSALADERRRTVLSVLNGEGRLDLSDVAARVVAREGPTANPATAMTPSTGDAPVTTVETGLYHVHAPTLDDAGLADYDPDDESLALADELPGQADTWLEVALDVASAHDPATTE